MTTQDETTLLVLKGAIASLSNDEQIKVHECATEIRVLVDKYGPLGLAALGLVGAQLAAEHGET